MATEQKTSTDMMQRARTSMIVPAATMVATWGVRRAMLTGYRLATGTKPPMAQDTRANLGKVLVWTVVMASTVAVAEVLVVRAVTHFTEPE